MEINHLLNAIGSSVQQAQEFLSQQDVERYMRYFKETDSVNTMSNEDNMALQPKAIRFSLGGKEQEKYIDVPLAVITPHETIGLKQVKVTISGEIYKDTQSQNILMNAGPSASESNNTHNGTIELVFESSPQSEGQARTTQKMLDKLEI